VLDIFPSGALRFAGGISASVESEDSRKSGNKMPCFRLFNLSVITLLNALNRAAVSAVAMSMAVVTKMKTFLGGSDCFQFFFKHAQVFMVFIFYTCSGFRSILILSNMRFSKHSQVFMVFH
jgi:hypothetical protein